MKLCYQFSAANAARQERLTGIVDASSRAAAIYQVRRMGLERISVKFLPWLSFVSIVKKSYGVPQDELARFYQTMSRRLVLKIDETEILRGAQEYLTDGRMRSAAALMYVARSSGKSLGAAMAFAGLPSRDASVISAIESRSAEKSKAFEDLARETQQRYALGRDLGGIFRMPKLIAALGWFGGLYLIFIVIMPAQIKILRNLGDVNLPDWIAAYFDMITWFNNHKFIELTCYFGIPLAFVIFIKSGLFTQILLRWKLVKEFIDLRDHCALWGSFAMLYAAGETPARISSLLIKTVDNPSLIRSLEKMARAHQAGRDNAVAVKAAGWPKWVEVALLSAYYTNFDEEMERNVSLWREDLSWKVSRLKQVLGLVNVGLQTFVMILFVYQAEGIPMLAATSSM